MSKRLQVVMPDRLFREISRAARARRTTLSEWVRQALVSASQEVSSIPLETKLAAIRKAVAYEFPVGPIEQINAEIESGYLSGFGR